MVPIEKKFASSDHSHLAGDGSLKKNSKGGITELSRPGFSIKT